MRRRRATGATSGPVPKSWSPYYPPGEYGRQGAYAIIQARVLLGVLTVDDLTDQALKDMTHEERQGLKK